MTSRKTHALAFQAAQISAGTIKASMAGTTRRQREEKHQADGLEIFNKETSWDTTFPEINVEEIRLSGLVELNHLNNTSWKRFNTDMFASRMSKWSDCPRYVVLTEKGFTVSARLVPNAKYFEYLDGMWTVRPEYADFINNAIPSKVCATTHDCDYDIMTALKLSQHTPEYVEITGSHDFTTANHKGVNLPCQVDSGVVLFTSIVVDDQVSLNDFIECYCGTDESGWVCYRRPNLTKKYKSSSERAEEEQARVAKLMRLF